MIDYSKFENLLEMKGVTASEVSKAAKISRSALTDWKMGRYTPKLDKIQKIADFFDVKIGYFMNEEQSPDNNAIQVNCVDYGRFCVLVEKFNKFRKERGKILKEYLKQNSIKEAAMGRILKEATHGRTGSSMTVSSWETGYHEPDAECLKILGNYLGHDFIEDWNEATRQVDKESWILGELLEKFSVCNPNIRNAILEMLEIRIPTDVQLYN